MKPFFVLLLMPFFAVAQSPSTTQRPSATDPATIAAATAACGSDSVQFEVKADTQPPNFEPDPARAKVFIAESFSPQGTGFAEPTLRIGQDGNWIGATRPTSWLAFTVEPGEHHLCVRWQSRLSNFSQLLALANFTAEAGKVYYFRSRVLSLGRSYLLDLDPVNEDEGRYLVLSSTHSDPRQKK
jgi:hypothetical protein